LRPSQILIFYFSRRLPCWFSFSSYITSRWIWFTAGDFPRNPHVGLHVATLMIGNTRPDLAYAGVSSGALKMARW
jgi:hypothetical protein